MKTILIVDDDANIVEIYRESLIREGFVVLFAQDGLAAMRSLHAEKPDLVILDLNMPKFNGAEVLKFIRTTPALSHTKVVMFSNYVSPEILNTTDKLGADASLLKLACAPEQLVNVVKTLLGDGPAGQEPPNP